VPTRVLRPDRDASATRVWLILWKATRAVERNAIASVAGLGLGFSEFAALEVLFHKGPQPVNAIGRTVLLTSGSITSAIDRLESRKLVRRAADPRDSRSRIVHLTAAGRALIAKAFQKHARDMEATLAVLNPSERLELVRLLKKAGMWAAARVGEPRASVSRAPIKVVRPA
jgi:MarR family 2-MHQ and catechol resistance regulon transcriptional repressor